MEKHTKTVRGFMMKGILYWVAAFAFYDVLKWMWSKRKTAWYNVRRYGEKLGKRVWLWLSKKRMKPWTTSCENCCFCGDVGYRHCYYPPCPLYRYRESGVSCTEWWNIYKKRKCETHRNKRTHPNRVMAWREIEPENFFF